MKTLWKTACTAVCLCALIISMTGCAQSSDSGDEPFFPDETPAEFSTIRIQVTDSIGGTVVSGTTLNVYKSGTTEQIGSGYTVTNGKVMLYDIATDQRYDFELIGEKGKWAGSRLENWKPLSIAKQNLSLIQPVHGTITRGITPPKITSAQSGNGSFTDIDENTVISASDKVSIVFESAVGVP